MGKYVVGVIALLMLAFASLGSAAGSSRTVGNSPSRATSPVASAASAGCSKATAVQVVERLHLGDPGIPNPSDRVAQVLCGAFVGSGSQAMVTTIANGTCWPNSGWAVFRFTGGAWQLVPYGFHGGFVLALAAVGSDIRETVPVWRKSDGPCNPSGGTRARTWHWNGTRFVASQWKVTQAKTPGTVAPPARAAGDAYFKTPSGNIVCQYLPGPKDMPRASLGCVIKSKLKPPPPRRTCQEGGYAGDRVDMYSTGPVSVPLCAGDYGAYLYVDVARVLGYGKTWSRDGFRCTSAETGLTCRNKSGHGFFLSREHWRVF
jgi:hypothetical protein